MWGRGKREEAQSVDFQNCMIYCSFLQTDKAEGVMYIQFVFLGPHDLVTQHPQSEYCFGSAGEFSHAAGILSGCHCHIERRSTGSLSLSQPSLWTQSFSSALFIHLSSLTNHTCPHSAFSWLNIHQLLTYSLPCKTSQRSFQAAVPPGNYLCLLSQPRLHTATFFVLLIWPAIFQTFAHPDLPELLPSPCSACVLPVNKELQLSHVTAPYSLGGKQISFLHPHLLRLCRTQCTSVILTHHCPQQDVLLRLLNYFECNDKPTGTFWMKVQIQVNNNNKPGRLKFCYVSCFILKSCCLAFLLFLIVVSSCDSPVSRCLPRPWLYSAVLPCPRV